jgi:phosphatidylinositol alpha-1,6-mannosyltransferase
LQRYLHDLVLRLPPERVAVLAPRSSGWRAFDATQLYDVRRWPATILYPTNEVLHRVRSLIRETGAEMVLFGHAFPLGLLGPRLDASEGIPTGFVTGGVEPGMARAPLSSAVLRYSVSRARVVFALTEFTKSRLSQAIPSEVPIEVLYPGVDARRFHPSVDGGIVRRRYGLDGAPVVACVSRLVRRKGQDVLIRGWRHVLRRIPEARLLIVGDGPYRDRLERLARDERVADAVVFTGETSEEELPAHYAACDVFAMPCRTLYGGLQAEGFGIVFLEAAGCARPSVAGDSGGAAEAVEHGRTGLVVDGADGTAVMEAVVSLLEDPALAAEMGRAGRSRIEDDFDWTRTTERLTEILAQAS